MNTLLLATLLSSSLMTPANPNPTPIWKADVPCGYDQVYQAKYYYDALGGTECGLTYRVL